ncbi:hypothetical protein [Bosea sp. (in: a-proteobacteria)]|uniref:hypothetical protein n=1 Tax=Bosea sp. (in: a-proteobacteria) TaxID=1871050 RepID=UPI002FC8AEC8
MAEDVREREARIPTEGGQPIPPMRADTHSNAEPAVETAVEARQGFLGKPVLMVLIWGLVLTVVAWIAVEMIAY